MSASVSWSSWLWTSIFGQRHSSNDYELVIRISRELESVLETEFGAEGRGLHEKIGNVELELTPQLVKRMRYLATIRNKLLHDAKIPGIPDRDAFIRAYDLSKADLAVIMERRRLRQAKTTESRKYHRLGTNNQCTVM